MMRTTWALRVFIFKASMVGVGGVFYVFVCKYRRYVWNRK